LQGPPLLAARGIWLLALGLTLLLALIGVPLRLGQLLQSADVRTLQELGLSQQVYAGYVAALDLASLIAHLSIASFIFWRRSWHGMCLLVSFTLITNGALLPLSLAYHQAQLAPALRLLADLVIYLGLVSSIVLLYVFPDGHFVPRWTRLLAVIWAALAFPAIFLPTTPFSLTRWPLWVQLLVLVLWACTGLYAQLYRFQYLSNPVQRQQIKWASLGLMAAIVGPFAYFLPFVILPSLSAAEAPNLLYQRVGPSFFAFSLVAQLAGQTTLTLALSLFPLLFAIAILRYRLWDIDLLINRALVYGALSAILALAYFVSVLLLGEGFRALTGQRQSQIATVLSTLALAASAAPLRRRLQTVIDRRFYRRKYDATRTLLGFGGVIRDEVDLDRLSGQLVTMVHETMQPEQVWLWLRPDRQTLPNPPEIS
jgi:hypothetical protein